MDSTKSSPSSDLLSEYGKNLARVRQIADDVIANSHVSLLGLLCGDVSPTVVWKIMYLSHTHPRIEERCTMLSVVTDYIVNSPTLLENKNPAHKPHASLQLMQVLAQCWQHTLPQAKKQLDAHSFTSFILTLARCILTLRSYNLHHDFHDVMKLSATLRDPRHDLSTTTQTQPPCFPLHALISSRKRLNITRSDGAETTSSHQLSTSHGQSIAPPTYHNDASPVRCSVPQHVAVTSACQNVIAPACHNFKSAISQRDFTSARLASTPSCQNIYPQNGRTTTTIQSNTVSSSCSKYFPECSPLESVRSELDKFDFVRSSPKMQLHKSRHTSTIRESIPKPATATILGTTTASRLSTARTQVADLRQSVHTENTRSSLHPKDRSVVKELYFNPE